MTDDKPIESRDDLLLELNFVPTWARRPPSDHPYQGTASRDPRDEPTHEEGVRGDRPPRCERPSRGERRDRRDDRRRRAAPPAAEIRVPHAGVRRPPTEAGRRSALGPDRFAESPARLALDVAFLPERHRLGAVAHRIQASRRAYPLLQVAELFLSRPEFHLVRLEIAGPPRGPAPAGADGPALYQCAVCGRVYAAAGAAARHIVARHAEEWFEVREAGEAPPTGAFTCVAQCGRSGRLLGPPNHHSFAEAFAEAHADVCPDMPPDDYRAQLVMVRDPAVIEQWRQAFARRRVFVRKGQPEAPPLSWPQARQIVSVEIAPEKVTAHRRVIIPATVAQMIDDAAIRLALRDAWNREQRFPMTMMIALRPALRHMGLHFFKAGGHLTFVSAVMPTPLTPDFAIPPIRAALRYLERNPGVPRDRMAAEVLGPDASETARAELFGHLQWLVEKGHVIEFFDGSLSVPRGRAAPGAPEAAGRAAPPEPPHRDDPPESAAAP